MTQRVLICDDEPNICFVLSRALRQVGFETTAVHTLAEAETALAEGRAEILFLDIFLPDGNGLDRLSLLRQRYPQVPIVVLTAHGTMRTALESMKRDAFDYITKPFDITKVQEIARRARAILKESRLAPAQGVPPPKTADGEEIIGNSLLMQEVYKTIGRVAGSDVTVLLQGECGTGKELVARAIHANSPRSGGPFVVVNCAAIPNTLLESELFGYVRGAFTGALTNRAGRFEQAHNGTLFLDEIGDLPLDLQAKLLRVLQEKTYQPLGSNETHHTNARIIAATNRDLFRAVREGDFREDLLYRLNVVSIALPPLRRRPEDIPALTEYFVRKYASRYQREPMSISPALAERFQRHSWPGNVRELENVIHRAVVMARGNVLTEEDAPLLTPETQTETGETIERWLRQLVQRHVAENRIGFLHEEVLQQIEAPLIRLTLEQTGGNKSRAADLLGINRNTLHAKMKRYGLIESEGEGE